jgi:hypothetical protein
MNHTPADQSGLSSEVKRGVVRWAIRETMGVILFVAAGRWD